MYSGGNMIKSLT